MHISKLLAVICVSAIGTSSLLAQKPDNDYQAKARQQLREAMGELNGQTPTNSTPAPVQPVKPVVVAPAVKPTPVPTQPVVTPTPVPVKPVVTPTVKPMVQTPVVVPQAQPAPAMVKRPAGLSPEAEMKAREALRQAEAQMDAQSPAGPYTAPPVMATTGKPEKIKSSGSKPVYTDIPSAMPTTMAPPPTTLSGSKEQRLNQLSQMYKADQITGDKYHQERAKILAEP